MYNKVTIKVNETPSAFKANAGLKGYLIDENVQPWEQVLSEAAAKTGLSPNMVEMCFDSVMNTAIRGIEEDGHTRRLGNYLELAVSVRGAFRDKGGKFDPDAHELALKLRPLSRFRRFSPRFGVYVENRAPMVRLDSLHSVSRPNEDGLVVGDELILTGRNLWHTDDCGMARYDYLIYKVRFAFGGGCSYTVDDWQCSEDGTRAVLPWFEGITHEIKPGNPPYSLTLQLQCRAGVPDADMQHHRITAKFLPYAK